MKILDVIMRVLLGLISLLPILGITGVFPQPTADMYTPQGWAFISVLFTSPYIMPLMGAVFVACFVLTVLNRMALAAILLAPITVNIICFHVFLDAAPISASGIPAYVLLACNAYFLWRNRSKYKVLW